MIYWWNFCPICNRAGCWHLGFFNSNFGLVLSHSWVLIYFFPTIWKSGIVILLIFNCTRSKCKVSPLLQLEFVNQWGVNGLHWDYTLCLCGCEASLKSILFLNSCSFWFKKSDLKTFVWRRYETICWIDVFTLSITSVKYNKPKRKSQASIFDYLQGRSQCLNSRLSLHVWFRTILLHLLAQIG